MLKDPNSSGESSIDVCFRKWNFKALKILIDLGEKCEQIMLSCRTLNLILQNSKLNQE